MDIIKTIAGELKLKAGQIAVVLELFEQNATIPFIARYRKERTGGLDEDQLREIEDRFQYLTILEARKETVLKTIEEQGKLTGELKTKILGTRLLRDLEDLYLPFKPKRKTRGAAAKAKGLEPLAFFIIENPNFNGSFDEAASGYIDKEKGVMTAEEAVAGAKDIIAEMISDSADVRRIVREFISQNSELVSKRSPNADEEIKGKKKDNYEVYHDFRMHLQHLKPHQILAVNRGENEKFLKISLDFDREILLKKVYSERFNYSRSVFADILSECVEDSFNRLIYPSIQRELRKDLTEKADLHAIEVFASNLRQLLLQPPVSGKNIMGIDPGFVSGSKVAVIDSTGKYLEGKTIYPHPPQLRTNEAKKIIAGFVKEFKVELIAIGNGTASRETELLIAELIKDENLDCRYAIVNEAGASVYSASPVAKEEFPDLEASMRGNISIARRMLDPLAELVKIDPRSIGVGMYQHDVDQKLLGKKLDDVVISCVNYTGVNLNTASTSLLTYVSGLNKRLAKAIFKFREERGKFTSREDLKNVSGLGEKVFEQCAGFLKIPDGENPLDNTFIHPEVYENVSRLLADSNVPAFEINSKGRLVEIYVKNNGVDFIADKIGVGTPTLKDILADLKKPGRDPREEMPKPILRSDVLKIEDLREGMKLKGTVRNVVDFGAFVDIGVKQDGLLHISQMADKFVNHPLKLVSVGDIIDVTIINVDIEKGRFALSMKSAAN